MALASPKPIFSQGCRDYRPHYKVGVQGPNRPEGPVPYISPPPPLIHAWPPGTNQGIQEMITTREAQQVDIGRLRDPLMRPQKVHRI